MILTEEIIVSRAKIVSFCPYKKVIDKKSIITNNLLITV
jgi:hypothetical protein